ncbi:MAG TPA: hypothetical protein VHJ20_19170 [Polyangia bacterium]|nr:hypothetical protein [Polyangia bacterium]
MVVASASRARAQVGEAEAAPSREAAPAVDARDDEAWRAYHEAFAVLVAGDVAGARARLAALVRAHPAHPAAAPATALLAKLSAPPPSKGRSRNGPSLAGRAELVVFQTLHGIVAGGELCAAVDCAGVRAQALAFSAMGGLGLGLSLGLTRDGVRAGDATLIDSGVFWGAWNGLALTLASGGDEPWAPMLGGQVAGLGLALGVVSSVHPTTGQVSLANSFGIWTTELTGLGLLAFSSDSPSRGAVWLPLLMAADGGLLAGALVAHGSTVSRGRMLLVDASGALGLLLGALVASGQSSVHPAAVTMMVGTALGLGVGGIATSRWDAPTLPGPASVSLLPVARPGGAGLTLGGTF